MNKWATAKLHSLHCYPYPPAFLQLCRFIVVGTIAAFVHFVTVIVLVQGWMLAPLVANIFAYLCGFQVSYWGHRSWTFSSTDTLHRTAFPKLLLVAGCGLVANESLFYVFLSLLELPYQWALFFVLTILPIITFILGKFWVFKPSQQMSGSR